MQTKHTVGKNDRQENDGRQYEKNNLKFVVNSKMLIPKAAIDPVMTRVCASMQSEDHHFVLEGYKPVFDKLSVQWCMIFKDRSAVLFGLR